MNNNQINSFLDKLNDSQRQAVEYIDGASLVIAGAGSGKTRVLTFKIAYLLTQGYKPWEIMALTFTNKAAREMKERIVNLVGDSARSLQMGTFHSVFARILRKEASCIGYDSSFTIYDESDSRSLCKNIVKQLELDEKVYKPADVHSRISWAKNKLMTPRQYADDMKVIVTDREAKRPEMARIFDMYVANCKKSNAMDFDDLLVYTFQLLKENEEKRKYYAEKFRFILVDEYQDTNYAQQQIVWLLAGSHKHICVVGDDAQSIYGFRGANIDNILDFQQQYDNSKLFKLEQNYRSTQCIVKAANSLIKHNDRQIPKDVFSRNDEGEKLTLRILTSDKEEAISVCKEIRKGVRNENRHYSDYAILYRTNYQSRTFEEQMLKENMPYRIYGGMSFYQRKEIKDIIAYFRIVANPHDEEAFRRVVNYPARGIGDTTVAKIAAGAQAYGESLWTVAGNPTGYGVNVNKGTMAKLSAFRELIVGFAQRMYTDDAFALGRDIIRESGITADIYSGTNVEDTSRQENLEEFVSSMQDFVEGNREEGLPVGLLDFLQDVSLMSDRENDGDDDMNRVSLMTIHSAKGLEFPVVYVVGLEENIFPSPMCTDSMRKLEEERRLLYVAITRAENRCILTCAKSRFRYGRMEFDAPSRFLKDIDRSLMMIEDGVGYDNISSVNRRSITGGGYGNKPEYSSDKPYIGSSYGYRSGNPRMQNNRPVASQFMADPKPKVTNPHIQEKPVNPYSETFERRLRESGANMHCINQALGAENTLLTNGRNGNNITNSPDVFCCGDKVEHSRFGVGTIVAIEGSGESLKAVVDFVNAGRKQLLLKFAKLKRI